MRQSPAGQCTYNTVTAIHLHMLLLCMRWYWSMDCRASETSSYLHQII